MKPPLLEVLKPLNNSILDLEVHMFKFTMKMYAPQGHGRTN